MSEYKFNPNNHLMQLKSKEGNKDYLPVQYRLVWFREACPGGTIETEMVHLDLTHEVTKEISVWNNDVRRSEKVQKTACGIAVFKAIIKDGNGGAATGYGSESAIDFGDFIEKAETKSIGRALAALGYGTQFAPELDEGNRIVDAPVDPTPPRNAPTSAQNGTSAPTSIINAPSVNDLRKRCNEVLGPNKWEPLLQQIIGVNKPDDNILPEECAKLKRALDTVEERRAAKKAS